MDEDTRVMYSLCIEDIQTVAEESFGRRLTKTELDVVEEELGDYVQWYDSIYWAIANNVDGITPISSQDYVLK